MSEDDDQANAPAGTNGPISDEPKVSRTRTLQALTQEELYEYIMTYAIQFAVLGRIETASNLIGKLNKHNWYNHQSHILRPLYILWDLIGQWPDREIDRVKDTIQAGRKMAAHINLRDSQSGEATGKKIRLEVGESPVTMEDVKKHVDESYDQWALSWWYPGRSNHWPSTDVDVIPSPHDRSKLFTVEELKNMLHVLMVAVLNTHQYRGPKGGKQPVDLSGALTSALELRIMLREKGVDDDGDVNLGEIHTLKMITGRLDGKDAHHQIEKLAQSRRAWPLLKNGALIKAMNIDEFKLDHFAKDFENAITERLEKGKQPSTLTIQQLTQAINTNTLTNPASLAFIADRGTNILHNPASASLIAETETRLGTKLPQDYKAYLALTNGNEPMWSGIIDESALSSCEDIRWIKENEDYISEMPANIPGDMYAILSDLDLDPNEEWPQLGNCIIIGSEDVDFTILVPPDTIQACQEKVKEILDSGEVEVTQEIKTSVRAMVKDFAGNMDRWEKLEWCVVSWSDGDCGERYAGFEEYLGSVAKRGKQKQDMWNLEMGEAYAKYMVKSDAQERETVNLH